MPECLHHPAALLIAVGNDGRRDDGLGWAFAREVEKLPFRGVIHYRYQLQVEDAALVAGAPAVLFVDASRETLPGHFAFFPCRPKNSSFFSTHAITPEAVLAVCRELYGNHPPAFLLAIEGNQWNLQQGLSPAGERRLKKALKWFGDQLSRRRECR